MHLFIWIRIPQETYLTIDKHIDDEEYGKISWKNVQLLVL